MAPKRIKRRKKAPKTAPKARPQVMTRSMQSNQPPVVISSSDEDAAPPPKTAYEPRPIITRAEFVQQTRGRFVSMAIYSDGSYGVPPEVMFSFPVTIGPDGNWKIVQGLFIDDFSKEKLTITGKELLEEKAEALSVCQD